jgi:hypothetical protein
LDFLGGSKTHADDLNPDRIELSLKVAVPATLDRSAKGPRSRVKPHRRRLSDQVAAIACGAIAIGRGKLRREYGLRGRSAVKSGLSGHGQVSALQERVGRRS